MPESSLPRMENWRFYLTALPCAVLGILGFIRLAAALRAWDFLVELGARPGPLYMAIGGALWGLLGWGAVALLASRPRGDWNRPAVFLMVLLLAMTYWVDVLGFNRSAEMRVNWPFSLIVTAVGLTYLFIMLRLPLWWRARKEAWHGE